MNTTLIHHTTNGRKVYENPVFGDKATFLKTSQETNGEYTLAEIELAPGGGNSKHWHTEFTETFRTIEGSLAVWIDNQRKILQPGESFTVPLNTLHYFQNPSKERVKFHVELHPGHEGFESSIKIAYGLATDGLTDKKGIPRNFSHLALLATKSGTVPAGIFSYLMPLFTWLAKRARKKGIEKELLDKYCKE